MKNYKKHKKFADVYDRLNKSIKEDTFYESIFLEYAIIQDRLSAVLAILDKNVVSVNGYKKELESILKEFEKINNEHVEKRITKDLISYIRIWKAKRNDLIHSLMNNSFDDFELKNVVDEGYKLTRKIDNKANQIIKHYKRLYKDRLYYALRKDCYIREFGDYGYIKSSGLFNDLTFDKSGKAFLSVLKRTPKNIEELAKEIALKFKDVEAADIKEDAIEFFDMLVADGYVVKGNNKSEVNLNNIGFTYKNVTKANLKNDYSPKEKRSEIDNQLFLDDYFVENPYLSSFQIELTSKCNERCIHCYIPHEYKNKNIDEKLFYSVLDQLEEMGTLGVTLSGGEPMCHPKFNEFLKAAKKKDFYVHVLSNLVLLDDEKIKIMKEGNNCGVQTSLYSMVPEHHDAITTLPGSFEKTKNSILRLIENDIPVQISCPVMKANKDDVAGVIEWGRKHKVRVNTDYAIMAEYDHQTGNLANRLSPRECKTVIKSIIEEDNEYKKRILDKDFTKKSKEVNIDPEKPFCGVGINSCCMVANGNVYPCPGWQGYICGNLNEKTLKEIWFDSKEMNYLRSLRKKDMPKCLKCKHKAFCHPCLARFANESKTGNPLEIAEHFCKVAKVNKEVVLDYIKTVKNK